VVDGSTYARTTPNQRDGGGRGYAAIDAGGEIVSSPNLRATWFDDFDANTVGNYSKNCCTLGTPANSITRLTATAWDPFFWLTATLPDFDGGIFQYVAIRYKYISGGLAAGQIYYSTAGHGFDAGYYKQIQLSNDALWHTILIDMHVLTAGGTDWRDHTITDVRFDLTDSGDAVIDIDFIGVVSKSIGIDLDNVVETTTRGAIHPGYVDASRRPTTLRRASDDMGADDVFRYQGTGAHTADNVAETATRSHVHPDAIDANRKVDLSKSGVINKSADNIAEGTTRKWAGESGADITGSHQAATIAGQGALATKSSVDLATGEVTNKNLDNVADGSTYARTTPNQRDGGGYAHDGLLSGGCVKPSKFADSNPGKITGAVQIATGSTADESETWINVGTVDLQVPAGAASIDFQVTLTILDPNTATCAMALTNNIGLAIYTGSAPSTPSFYRAGTGTITYTTPSGTKLSLYVKGRTVTFPLGGSGIEGICSQDLVTPLRSGMVA
jgi:hypothetical protein